MPDTSVPFGRYRLTEQLGQGGMAVVYRGVSEGPEGFKRPVVIKRILPTLASDPSFVRMLISEARLSALLLHPGIVQVYELGNVDGEFYLAMEFVDGIDLGLLLIHCSKRKVGLTASLCCYIAHELANALEYAHSLKSETGERLGIVHRDISPSNVLISNLGDVKLLDFGIAKAASSLHDEQSRTGSLKGKLAYMSPEQAEGHPVDARSDLFSLGIMLHELLTMRRLFRGDDDLQTLRLVREARVEPPSVHHSGLDPALDAVVLKMLARLPEERYQSADEVARALSPLLHRYAAADASTMRSFLKQVGPIERSKKPLPPATPSSSQKRTHSGYTAGGPTPSAGPGTSAPHGRRSTIVLSALVSGLALAAVIGWGATRTHPAAEVAPLPTSPSAPVGPTIAPSPVAPAATAPTATVPTPAPSPAPPEARRVRLSVRGKAGARLFVDGKAMGTLPQTLVLAATAGTRSVVVEAAGYRAWHAEVSGEQDTELTAALKPTPTRIGKGLKLLDPFP